MIKEFQEKQKQVELFIKSTSFDRAIRLGIGIVVPFTVLYFLGYFEYAPAVVVGVLLNAPGDIPGDTKHKINALFVSIALTMLVTAIIFFAKPFLPLLLISVFVISFFVSMISVYGFRASLISFSGLMSMVLAFAVEKETTHAILLQIGLMGIGGLWYLLLSLLFQTMDRKKDQNQLLSDTLSLIGQYLKMRGELLTKKKKRDELLKKCFTLQHLINEKQETLRETLLTERKRSGLGSQDEKQLLIFISSINIFELIEAKHLDYQTLDSIFGERKSFLENSKILNRIMGDHLVRLSELMIQKDKIPDKNLLLESLSKAKDSILAYIEAVQLPEAREGALVLKNLYDYQEQILREIRAIRRVMANIESGRIVPVKKQETRQFLTQQEYRLQTLVQNLSLKSTMFRHSLRFAISIVFAYTLGILLDIQNTYWILLTIVVIMRPSYGLTKQRSKDRIIGTVFGAIIAVGIVIITQNVVVYSVLALGSLVLAFSLIQQNYKWAAALITLSIVFVYSLINPNAFEVIQYRVLDTVLGAILAVITNYTVFPSWEANNLRPLLLNTLKMNRNYLLATQMLYENVSANKLSYNLARKEAFLAVSNLNASFQRLTQDPKSKQMNYQLIYDMVTLNQTILSAIASIGNFVYHHQTTPASNELSTIIKTIAATMQNTYDNLSTDQFKNETKEARVDKEQEKLFHKFRQLAKSRDEKIKMGNPELDLKTLHSLQEAYLISNQVDWLKSLSENLQKVTKKYQIAGLKS